MKHSPYRLFSNPPGAFPEERPAIFGLETEYAVLYLPEDPDDDRKPPFLLIEEVIFSILLTERKAAVSGGIKRGYFLQNGGLVHLEIFLRHQGDTPILEAATPECRSPWDLLVYARAFDRLLTEISRKSAARLLEMGYRGYLAFGKNNVDSRGVGFGCHENYLVHLEATRAEKALYLACLPLLIICLLPACVVLLALLTLGLTGYLLGLLMPFLRAWGSGLYKGLMRREVLWQNLLAVYQLGSNGLFFPAIWIYTRLLRLVAFRPFTRDLSSLLITRQILTGAGALNFEKRAYEISQRARMTTSLSNIIIFGRGKTVYDFKGMLYAPRSLFRSTKKLSVTVGDSNLSDISMLLKVGTTALVIDMIENGCYLEDLRPRKPIDALKRISLDGPWKQIELKGGRTLSAVDIQREYLARAREFFKERPESRVRHEELLNLWEETLERLAERPQSLADSLDWVAKKSLLDGAITSGSGWKSFLAWGHFLTRAGIEASRSATDLTDLLSRVARWRRRDLRRTLQSLQLDPVDFERQRDLYFLARKIDLRFHELSAPGGYQRSLERDGLLQRLTVHEDIERASREPPQDTRARVRGYYIQLSPKPEEIQANWGEVVLSPFRHIPLSDPFFYRLPGDD